MIFEFARITDEGKALLARSVSGGTLVWGTCECSDGDISSYSDDDINAMTYLPGVSVAKGTATAVFLDAGNVASISCQVLNSEPGCSAGYARTFGLWARIEGETGEVLVVVSSVGSHQPTYFPTYTSAETRLLGIIDLSVILSSGVETTVVVNESAYALASSLKSEVDARVALSNRVVTTHAESSEFVGEVQSILGAKTFSDSTTFRGGIKTRTITSEYDGYSIEISAGGGVIIGNNDIPVYTTIKQGVETPNAKVRTLESYYNTEISLQAPHGVHIYKGALTGGLTVEGDVSCDGISSETIEASEKITTPELVVGKLTSNERTSGNFWTLSNPGGSQLVLYPNYETASNNLGALAKPFTKLYLNDGININDGGANVTTITSSEVRTDSVYANSIHGTPYMWFNSGIPDVGCICIIAVTRPAETPRPGQRIRLLAGATVPNPYVSVSFAKMTESGYEIDSPASFHEFKILTTLDWGTGSTGQPMFVLALCTANNYNEGRYE